MPNDASINRTGPLAVARTWPGANVPVAAYTSPVINSFTGTLGQGNTLSLAVSGVTAKRSGQLFFFGGDPAKDGLPATDILPDMNATHTAVYKHSTAVNYSGTGAGLYCDAPSGSQGAGNPYVVFARQSDAYFSVVRKIRIVDTGVIAEGNQLKCERMIQFGNYNDHANLHNTHFWTPDADHSPTFSNDWSVIFSGPTQQATPQMGSWSANGALDSWVRTQMRLKLSTPDVADGSIFFAQTNEDTGQFFDGGVFSGESPEKLIPKNDFVTVESTMPDPQGVTHFFLPFFMRPSAAVQIEVGMMYINDSCERVELGNAPTYDTCTKRVVQEQVQRIPGQVDFKVYLANINPSTEPVYAFVFNQDGHYSPGYKVGGV